MPGKYIVLWIGLSIFFLFAVHRIGKFSTYPRTKAGKRMKILVLSPDSPMEWIPLVALESLTLLVLSLATIIFLGIRYQRKKIRGLWRVVILEPRWLIFRRTVIIERYSSFDKAWKRHDELEKVFFEVKGSR